MFEIASHWWSVCLHHAYFIKGLPISRQCNRVSPVTGQESIIVSKYIFFVIGLANWSYQMKHASNGIKQWLYSYFIFTQWILYDSLIGVHIVVTALLEYFNHEFNELKSDLTGPRALPQSLVWYCNNFIICISKSSSYALLSTWCSKNCCTYCINKKRQTNITW